VADDSCKLIITGPQTTHWTDAVGAGGFALAVIVVAVVAFLAWRTWLAHERASSYDGLEVERLRLMLRELEREAVL
jgi:uncharacterized membrane protein YbhN (UPF0104 family)